MEGCTSAFDVGANFERYEGLKLEVEVGVRVGVRARIRV